MFKTIMILLCGAVVGAVICTYSTSARHGVTTAVAENLGNINRDAQFHRQNPAFIGPPTAAQVSPSALNASQNMDQHHKVVKDQEGPQPTEE